MEKTDNEKITEYLNDLRSLIGEGKLDRVLSELKTLSLPEDYKVQAFQISFRLFSLRENIINGLVDHQESSRERNAISYAALELLGNLRDDPAKEIHWFYDDDNYDIQVASTLTQLTEDALTTITSSPGLGNAEVVEKFSILRDCLQRVVSELENNKYRGPAWGELSAVIDTIPILLRDRMDKEILENVVRTIKQANMPRRSRVLSYVDDIIFRKDIILSHKTSIGYIDGLLKVVGK